MNRLERIELYARVEKAEAKVDELLARVEALEAQRPTLTLKGKDALVNGESTKLRPTA